ncbi:MAG: methyltransferase domain-containing protein [Thermoplasmatales archaeon]|nr:methyltransferase domain-containing protein [Thermoplasmatales archaeon]
MKKRDAIDFYQKNWPLIVKLLQVDKTHCIHHGYYEKGIRTHIQSVLNMNDLVGRLLELDSKKKQVNQVLDAGCGIGGTMIHLAKKYPNINFTGITIVSEHIEMAKDLAKENQVDVNTDFILEDFMETGFSSNQFDAIYLIESASYSPKKQILIREMYRILKPGGTLVIIDCFRTDVQFNQFLNNIYVLFCKGWALPNLIALDKLKDSLKTEGFHEIITSDLTKNVRRTIIMGDVLSIPYLVKMVMRKIIQGKSYQIEEDPELLAAASLLSTIIGLKKGITYNAVTAIK